MHDAATFPIGLSVAEARARIVEIAAKFPLPTESVPLAAAHGRVLAADVIAPRDVPGFANSAMDGYAVRGADLPSAGEKAFHLCGVALAGQGEIPAVAPGTCVRITTGAPLPPGADTVVMQENARVDGDTIRIAAGTVAGVNVRAAAEDYAAGDLAFRRGTRLSPARVAVLASFGLAEVRVVRRPRAVLLTTGDELVAAGAPLAPGRIPDSNCHSLAGLLGEHGVALLRHERLRDEPERLRAALVRAGSEADLVVSSGGVSVGEADFLPRLVAQIGEVYFWKVRIRPGMPFLFGRVGAALAFGLPGNPVSGIATFLTLVRPALAAMSGATAPAPLYARLAGDVHKRHARAEYQRARLECDAEGRLHARPLAHQGSGMLRGVAEADALIVLPEDGREFRQGQVVEVVPLPGWPGL